MRRLPQVLAVALMGWLFGALEGKAADGTAALTATAKEHFKQGRMHYQLGEYQEALKEFKEVYRLKQDASLLYNIAQCYRLLSEYSDAIDFYSRYLREAPDASNRSEVEEQIRDLEAASERQQQQKQASAAPLTPPPKKTAAERLPPLKKLLLGKDLYAKHATQPSPIARGVTLNPDPKVIFAKTTLEFGVGVQNRSNSPVAVIFSKSPAYPMKSILSVMILSAGVSDRGRPQGPEVYDGIGMPLYFEQVDIPANTELRVVTIRNLDELEYRGKPSAKLHWAMDLEGLPAQGEIDIVLPEMRSLHLAARKGWLEEVSKLIARGADVNALDRYGNPPLVSAVEGGDAQVVALLLKSGAKSDRAFLDAAAEGKLDVVRALVEGGADVRMKDDKWQTAIHWAAQNGHAEVVTYLAGKGVDVNAKDGWGHTALENARDEETRAALKEAATRYHAESQAIDQATARPRGQDAIISQVKVRVLHAPSYFDLDGQPRQFTELGYRQVTMVIDAKKTVCRFEPIVHPPYDSVQLRQLKDWRAAIEQKIKRTSQDRSSWEQQEVRYLERFLGELTDGTFPVLSDVRNTFGPIWQTLTDMRVLEGLASRHFDIRYDYFKSDVNRRVTVEFQRSSGGTLSLTYPETYVYLGVIESPFPKELQTLLGPLVPMADSCVEEIAAKRIPKR